MGRVQNAATVPPNIEVFATSKAAKFNFIVDTGAAVSVLPLKIVKHLTLNPTPVKLSAANRTQIEVYGEALMTFTLGSLRRDFSWNFVVADTSQPLLGQDFLAHHKLLIDCAQGQLIDPITERKTGYITNGTISQIIVNEIENMNSLVIPLFEKYPSLLKPKNFYENPKEMKVSHTIDTENAHPTFCKTRRLTVEKEQAAKTEYGNLLKMGILRPSKSPWSSPLHLVKKSTGEWRPVGDYRNLNAITKPDRYPVPHLHSVTAKLRNKNMFSKIDLMKAYHQIPMNPSDIEKTAISTPFGLYEYVYMPFGLKNAGATFQRYMDNLFLDVPCAFVYFDDIIVFSENQETHQSDLEKVIKILHDNDLKISINKCEFFRNSIDFLGYNVSCDGLKPTNNKTNEISSFPQPRDSKTLRRFLGLINFYRRLIPQFANKVLLLTNLIKLNPNAKTLDFSADQSECFESIKRELSSAVALPHPSLSEDKYQMVTDSSNYAVGAALHQMIDGQPVPIGFFSKKLSSAQCSYSAFDRELLAAYLAVLHFKPFIESRDVTIFTDHKPLVSAFKSQNPAKSDRQQRHLSLIAEYISVVEYIKGNQNIVADCLSRPTHSVCVDATDLPAIARHQSEDEEMSSYSSKLTPYPLSPTVNIYCEKSMSFPRPFIPVELRDSIFHELHSLCHPGTKTTLKMIKARYYWPDMDKFIREKCRECLECQQSKVHRHTKSEVKHFHLPSNRFEAVHIDLVGPLPPAKQFGETYTSNNRYILTMIDRATRWVEAVPLDNISAATVAIKFLETWISRFGVPLYLISDRGAQFESELFQELSKMIGFHRLRTTSYHPQTNGMVERMHRTLKNSIKARNESWIQSLPIVVLGLRSIPNESNFSPFTSVTGSYLNIPRILKSEEEEFNNENIKDLVKCMSEINFESLSEGIHHSSPPVYIPNDLLTCTHVWLRRDRLRKALEAPYTGPFLVMKRLEKVYVIEDAAGKEQTVSIDRLKPAYLKKINPKNSPSNISPPIEIEPAVPPLVPNTDEDIAVSEDDVEPPRRSRTGRNITFKRDNQYHYY